MTFKQFKLIKKTKLNHSIYELVFESNESFSFIHWQFITFILPWIWWRAYSVLEVNNKNLTLLIKKREKIDGWRWWSIFICEREIWDILEWVWPTGHFILKNNNKNKLFIWTGTGFVPLYNQILWSLKEKQNCNLKMIFWSRYLEDLFYLDEIKKLKNRYSNFDYEIYLSKENIKLYEKWYVIDYLTKNNIADFKEFYICWIPSMIDSAKEILKNLWIKKENIFTEKY